MKYDLGHLVGGGKSLFKLGFSLETVHGSGHLETVFPNAFQLGLPGGGWLAIPSLGLCSAAAVLLSWYIVVWAEHSSAPRERARALAFALLGGGLAWSVALFMRSSVLVAVCFVSALSWTVAWSFTRRGVHRTQVGGRNLFAPALCVFWMSMAIGSWMDGWMFGQVAEELGWVGVFPPGSPASITHHAAGLIQPGSTHSLPTHPVPLYHALLAGLALPLAFRFRDRGLALPLVLFLLGSAGILLDPLRADSFRGGSSLTWSLLSLCFAFVLAWDAKHPPFEASTLLPDRPGS